MDPVNPLTYKRRSKLRSKTRERFSGLNAKQKNAAIQKLQERISGQTDSPKAPALQAKLAAARNPLIHQAAEKAGFKRPEVEGFKGASNIGRLSEKISGLGTPTAGGADATKLAALQAKLAEQKGFRKQIGTARRTALGPDFDRTKLAYAKKKKKVGTQSNTSATPTASGNFSY